MTKSASANAALVSEPVTSALEPVGLVRADPLLAEQPVDLAVHVADAACPAASWSRSVSTTGTCSRRANSSASWPAISPAPTTPTLVTGRASAVSGAPAGRWARFCTRSNAYSPARSSSLMIRSASASSSAAKPVVQVGGRGPARSAPAPGTARARRRAAARRRSPGRGRAPRPRPRRRGRPRRAVTVIVAGRRTRAAQRSDCSRKSAASNSTSTTPSSSGLRRLEHAGSG